MSDRIMQGTTPEICIEINKDDLLVSDIEEIDLWVVNGRAKINYAKDRLVLDNENNTITVHFSKEETLRFSHMIDSNDIAVQFLAKANDEWVGIEPIYFEVEKFIGK